MIGLSSGGRFVAVERAELPSRSENQAFPVQVAELRESRRIGEIAKEIMPLSDLEQCMRLRVLPDQSSNRPILQSWIEE